MDRARSALFGLLDKVFHYYSLALVGLIALISLELAPAIARRIAWFGLAFVALAAPLFWWDPHPTRFQWRPDQRLLLLSLVAITLFAYVLRLLPLQETRVVMGYDYGFYEAAMQAYETSPHESDVAPWIKSQFEPGLLLMHQVLQAITGLDAFEHLRHLWPLFSALLTVPLFVTARAYVGTGGGLVAAAFYAVGFTQYTVHEYLYEKNVIALALLLVLFVLVHRRSWAAAGIIFGALGIWHRPTLLLAAAALAVYGTYRYTRDLQMTGLAKTATLGLVLFLPLWILRAEHYFQLGLGVIQHAGENVGAAVPEGGGTFLSFLEYQNAAITYLPLALAGALLTLRQREALLPAIAFLFAFLNVTFQLFFFNRFIIMLDLVSLLLVGAAFVATVPPSKPWMRPTVLGFLLLFTAMPTVQEATRAPGPPYLWVSDAQYEGIDWVRENTETNATVLASNLDAPYVLADSDRRTFGPGLFDDPRSGTEWRTFFQTNDEAEVRNHLAEYGMPLYVYHAEGHGPGLGTGKFREPLFSKVYDAGGAQVWKYNG